MTSTSRFVPVAATTVLLLVVGYMLAVSALGQQEAADSETTVEIAFKTVEVKSEGEVEQLENLPTKGDPPAALTNHPSLTITATVKWAKPGRVEAFVHGTRHDDVHEISEGEGNSETGTPKEFTTTLTEGRNQVYVQWIPYTDRKVREAIVEKAKEEAEKAAESANGAAVEQAVAGALKEIIKSPADLIETLAGDAQEAAGKALGADPQATAEKVAEEVAKAVQKKLGETEELITPVDLSLLETDSSGRVRSKTHEITLDTVGPQLSSAKLIEVPGAGPTLIARFKHADLKQVSKDNFTIARETTPHKFESIGDRDPELDEDRRTVRFYLGPLTTGAYQFTVHGTEPEAQTGAEPAEGGKKALSDEAGNPAGQTHYKGGGKDQFRTFSSLPEPERGEHVAFPQFTPPAPMQTRKEGFNPADYVVTRVARLYYFRDAHRVAEIINRNVKSYNRAAVTQAERRAEDARDDAEEKTDSRRAAERAAVRAAQAARNAEAQLATAREALREARSTETTAADNRTRAQNIAFRQGLPENADSAQKRAELSTARNEVATTDALVRQRQTELDQALAQVPPDPIRTRQAQQALQQAIFQNRSAAARAADLQTMLDLEAEARRADTDLASFGGKSGIGDLEDTVRRLEQSVAELRQEELRAQEASDVAQATEDRAKEKQFREEVAAATEDPDTYVPGDYESVDPVTQVSISVIGEGVIHLRGPIKGINKIRTMIDQIDSPLGQIKIGIHTVQVNGEKGDRMERVVGRIEGDIDLGRFLVNQSLNLLRKAIQTEAARIASEQAAMFPGHYQVDRDRRYLYAFFGRDFIDELFAMDSEFLRSENSILSLHSMDTISLNRALFILALAKNDVRENILQIFMQMVRTDLPQAEYDYRRSSELRPHRSQKLFPPWNLQHLPVWNKHHCEEVTCEAVFRNACQRYHFRNLRGFFAYGFQDPDVMNPMQREFIRLSQIFKARMVAEMEWRQRFLERALIEDPANDERRRRELLEPVHEEALQLEANAYKGLVTSASQVQEAAGETRRVVDEIAGVQKETAESLRDAAASVGMVKVDYGKFREELQKVLKRVPVPDSDELLPAYYAKLAEEAEPVVLPFINVLDALVAKSEQWDWMAPRDRRELAEGATSVTELKQAFAQRRDPARAEEANRKIGRHLQDAAIVAADIIKSMRLITQRLDAEMDEWRRISRMIWEFNRLIEDVEDSHSKWKQVEEAYDKLKSCLGQTASGRRILAAIDAAYEGWRRFQSAEGGIDMAQHVARRTRLLLNHRKLLNHLIDEQEDKYIELVEGTRAHVAVLDNYLKRLAIALEDDFEAQFYDPAFVRIRGAAREYDVTLGQVERTTILTNNRAFAKVTPEATMEFDLPKRDIAIVEAFDGAKALVQDYGALMNDPTFLAAFQMMGGAQQPTTVKNVLPSLPTSTDAQTMGLVPRELGEPQSSLERLVPDPAIYKFETGTGFQIRPVIQPDGDSVIYDFDYMYTTNVREPVRADEKHLGRVKRHFVHTQVQTSSFEIREISRYQVALKAARTAKGVPLFEDIPVLGAAFRPAPSAESSIQQNIILGQTTVYPTVFDLMGLRWAPHVVDIDHVSLLDSEHIVRGRNQSIDDFVFEEASKRVDDLLNLKKNYPDLYRPDLYHERGLPSPHHPGGYFYRPYMLDEEGNKQWQPLVDPNGTRFERLDRRPPEMQDPPFELYRHRPVLPERVGPATSHQGVNSAPRPMLRVIPGD